MLVGTMAAVVAFTLAGLAVQALNLSYRTDTVQRRRNVAESVVAQAMAEVLTNLDYGKPNKPGENAVFRFKWDGDEGLLTFSEDEAERLKIPVSTNNLGQDVPATGPDYSVPSDVVHLVGVGRSRGTTTTIEVLLHSPPFPFVISSSGTFQSSGSLLVGRLNPDKGLTALSPDDLLPGHLATNGPGGESVKLGSQAVVTGDVQSVGTIKLDGAQVRGEVRQGADEVRIPPVDLTSYRPEESRSETIAQANLVNPTLDGYYVRQGSLSVNGGLNLDQGVVYVDGDLEVSGGIRGRGALIVTGKTTVNGGVELSTDNRVALLSGGDVAISGNGRDSSFRGLVYTEGDFDASDVSVVGTFVGNKPGNAGGSRLELRDARMIQEPGAVQVGLPSYTMAYDFVTEKRTAEVVPVAGNWADAMFKFFSPTGAVKTQAIENQDVFEPLPSSFVFRMGFTANGRMKVSLKHPILGGAEAVFERPNPGGNVPLSAIKAVEKPMVDFLNSRNPTKGPPPPPLKGLASFISWSDVDAVTALQTSGTLAQFIAALPAPKKNTVYDASFDISQFLAPGDRIRVLLWTER